MSSTNENPTASDWATTRGDRWSAQLTKHEAKLAPVDEPFLQALQLDAPLRICEVGCGGGGTTLALRDRAPAGSFVHAFDISPTLLAAARARAGNDPRVAFDRADMATAKPDQLYDRLASRFGIMFFDDPPAAFANLAQWLAPGGRFAFAAWCPASENPWMVLVRDVVASVIALPTPDPSGPGPFRYGDASLLVALLERAGFSGVAVNDWHGAFPIGGALAPDAAARFALEAFSSFGELLARAGGGAFEEAHRRLTKVFEPHYRDGAVYLGGAVHVVTGGRNA
jgi:SAM-dependent methyltransferase